MKMAERARLLIEEKPWLELKEVVVELGADYSRLSRELKASGKNFAQLKRERILQMNEELHGIDL